jgi:hypothetical protein
MAQSFLAGYPDKPVLVSKQVIENAEADVAVATRNADVAKKTADATVAAATTADQISESRDKAAKAQLDLKKAQIELDALIAGGVPANEGQGKAASFYSRMLSAEQSLEKLKQGPDSLIGRTASEIAPGLTAKVSSSERTRARDLIKNFLMASLRRESGAVIAPFELTNQYSIYFPSADASPEEIAEKRQQRILAIGNMRNEAGPAGPVTDKALLSQGFVPYGMDAPPESKGPPPQTERTAGAGAETTTIEVPKEFQAALIEYVNTKGKDIDPKEFQTFFNNAAKTYGFSGRVSDEEAKRNVDAIRGGARFGGAQPAERPLTPVERGVNEALLSTPGGVATGLVNATTFGIPAMLDEDIGRTVEGVREESPLATGAGDILGSAAMTALGGAGLRAVGMSAPKAEGLADLLYSATTGATGAPEGERLSGAATNTVLAGMGSAAPSVVKRVLKPNTDEDIKILRDAGVRLSPMQTVGGRPDQVEEAASRLLLGGGDLSIAARRRAFNDFGTAYLNKAGQYIGFQLPRDMKPQARMKAIGEAFDKQYDALRSQMTVAPDQDLLDDITNLKLKINDGVTFSPDNASRLNKLLDDQLVRRTKNPIGGDEYKSLSSLLKTRKREFAKRGDQELADGVGDMEYILEAAARRRSPPDVVDMMNQTDRGFAILAQAQEAARMAGTRPGDFSPAQILSRQRAGDTRARSRSFIEGDMEGQRLAEAGQNILGNVLPSSGTTERLASGLTVTGGGAFLSPATLLPNALIGLINAPGVRDVLPKIFAGQRPKPIEAIGSGMEMFKTPLSLLGSATAQQFNPIEQTPEDYAATTVEPLPQPDIRYDPETKTYILPNGRRVFADGTPADEPEGMYRGGLMDLARKYR